MSNDQRPTRDIISFEQANDPNMWEIAAIGKMFEGKSLCTKQNGYDIIAGFRRKNPFLNMAMKYADYDTVPWVCTTVGGGEHDKPQYAV